MDKNLAVTQLRMWIAEAKSLARRGTPITDAAVDGCAAYIAPIDGVLEAQGVHNPPASIPEREAILKQLLRGVDGWDVSDRQTP